MPCNNNRMQLKANTILTGKIGAWKLLWGLRSITETDQNALVVVNHANIPINNKKNKKTHVQRENELKVLLPCVFVIVSS